jgi:transposase
MTPRTPNFALELLLCHPEKLSPLEPESVPMRSLRRLVEARRTLVNDRVRLTNRITAALKAFYPQVLGWFRDKDASGRFRDGTYRADKKSGSTTLAALGWSTRSQDNP